jgi:hypothetical protein
MSGEREWVEKLRIDIEDVLKSQNITVKTAVRLPYQIHVSSFGGDSAQHPKMQPSNDYQTDLLIAEPLGSSGDWVPRVVVEFKLGSVTTHDALTYSAKAATHRNVHPYLRYGIIIGGHPGAVPRRLIRHGHQFDFMLTLASNDKLIADERDFLCKLLQDEVRASREMSELLSTAKSSIRLVHRKLINE